MGPSMIDLATLSTIAGLLGISAKELIFLIKSTIKKMDEKGKQRILAERKSKIDKMVGEGILTKALRLYYSAENLKKGNLTPYSFGLNGMTIDTSIATRPTWVGQAIGLTGKNEQCDLVDAQPPQAEISRRDAVRLLALLEAQGLKLWDSQIYRLLDLDLDANQFKAKFALESFLHYRFTDGLLPDELVEKLLDVDFDIDSVLARSQRVLPQRQQILPDGHSLVDFGARICAGGPTVVFAYARPKPYHDYAILIQQRSEAVTDAQGMTSVIPQAFHQPIIDINDEISLSSSVYREIYEELLEGQEAERDVRRLKHDWYMAANPAMRWLKEHRKLHTIDLVSAGINLDKGSYEFSVLFAIHDSHFYETYGDLLKPNWEAKGVTPYSTMNSEKLAVLLGSPNWASEGLFALVESLLHLKAFDPKRVRIPSLERFV
jgi:hypothetical protein